MDSIRTNVEICINMHQYANIAYKYAFICKKYANICLTTFNSAANISKNMGSIGIKVHEDLLNL